ncbi:MAG: curli production assembly protein CsgF [Gammaproteobacteria bacterium]|nr:curli production assembly protein CsgF [Gammaproteobacteria bacterium]
MIKQRYIIILIGIVNLAIMSRTIASELTYQPINPSFGGFPSNGTMLLNQANAQNNFKDPDAVDPFSRSPLDRFNETLERQVLSQLARRIVEDAFGTSTGVGTGGIYTTDNFSIEIDTSDPAVINLIVTDLSTGDISTIQIPYF